MKKGNILLIEDDLQGREFLNAFLVYRGFEVRQAADPHEAFNIIEEHPVELVITDLMMPKMNGLEFLKKLKQVRPEIVTIVCSAYNHFEMTSNLLKAGAFFCVDKPFNLEELETHILRGLEHYRLQCSALKGRPVIKNRTTVDYIVGESERILSMLELIEKVAESDSTVLIQGESGTGKELVARAIHDLSSRRTRNFVPVNCGAIPDDLLESELFGHVKGSFTGAVANRVGRFEMADNGTLFLDEIGDMKPNLQVKLLRVLQNKEIEPVGGGKPKKISTRIVAATHQNLERMVEERSFREDLFYRLSVIPILVPPLRERKEDIPILVDRFITRMNEEKRRAVTGIEREALQALCDYDWPGNIRELENLMERLVIIKGEGKLTLRDIPDKYAGRKSISRPDFVHLTSDGLCLNSVVEEFENRLIMEALEKTGGNKKEAAQLLNLKRTTFIEKLKKKNMTNGDCIAACS